MSVRTYRQLLFLLDFLMVRFPLLFRLNVFASWIQYSILCYTMSIGNTIHFENWSSNITCMSFVIFEFAY